MLANRLSWFFNFRGTSVNLDSACSSSLLAVHLACQDLRAGSSSMVRISVFFYIAMNNLSTYLLRIHDPLTMSSRIRTCLGPCRRRKPNLPPAPHEDFVRFQLSEPGQPVLEF